MILVREVINQEDITLEINEEVIDLGKKLDQRGYFYYDSLSVKNPNKLIHIYKRKDKYYMVKKVFHKGMFVEKIILQDITDTIQNPVNRI